ncbi:DUF3144 domain-containing protein [Psychrobacter sp.]|uniref:DUF3144 domain-containing protein n=1 Tax=Psychrobacter sp. TaxID=56811 RepID=UPI0026008025|nr:DUF3144 domain-containing protein [Psychrobacter sp.]
MSDNNKTNDTPALSKDIEAFYKRADAIIELSNAQLGPDAHSGQVGASLLYAAARYSASVASIGFVKGSDLAKEKNEIVEFYAKQYRQMLSDNLDDYADNFDKYVQVNND